MASDIILLLDGIKGESQDKDHKDEGIDVLSWSWGMTQSGSTHHGTGSTDGKVNVQDLSVTKNMDKSSTTLQQYCASGKHIPEVKLICYKSSGDNRIKGYVQVLKNVIISSYSTGGISEQGQQTENVSFNHGKFKNEYTQQMADGTAGASTEVAWDIAGKGAE